MLTTIGRFAYSAIEKTFIMKTLKKNGFSLLELMIAIALMAIISAFAAPKMADYMAERRLRGAARMVMSDLMAARAKAITLNQKVKVSFGNNHAYEIWNDADSNETVADNEGDDLVKDIHPDYYDITFNASANPVFSSRGTAFGATVTLTSSKTGGYRCVRVASTGRVKIDTDNCP